jgi:phosphoglycolate phosphatase
MTKAAQKFIVWDWNGTLFDDVDAMLGAFNHVFAHLGYVQVDMAGFRKHYAIPIAQMYRNHGFSNQHIAEIEANADHGFHDHYENLALQMPMRDGALDLLNDLRGKDVHSYILSNHLVEPIKAQLRRLQADHLLDEVLAYADSATQFKDMTKGERMRRYMAQHGLQGPDGIVIGDSAEETHIGRELGMATIAITGGGVSEERLRDAKPDYLIHDLHELRPILQERKFL